MKKVRFRMYWEVSGLQTLELSPDINTTDEAIDYINDNFDDVPLPDDFDYDYGSDGFDECSVEIYEDDINERN